MNEHHIEAQLKKAVEASGGLCWKLVCPGTTGVPDRLCLMGGQLAHPAALDRPRLLAGGFHFDEDDLASHQA